ncbi:MAG TPA: glycosyltransferase family 2 protein [Thermoanaerobaculia bacterium]|nr:glycosyltransferase family 2 protein [Thermoanaerobaculia bacterium]
MRETDVSIVIPVRDEQENLPALIEEIDDLIAGSQAIAEVILVDDGSRDRSWDLISGFASTRPWLRALRLRAARGQTAAMAAGVSVSQGGLVAFLDADLQNDPGDIPSLIRPIIDGKADVVCGWRRQRRDLLLTRRLPSRVANWIIASTLHLPIHDIGCTLKVFRREYLEGANILGEMHRFLPAYSQALGARIIEMEVNHRPREGGRSKYGVSRAGKVMIDLLTVVMLSTYGSSPAYLFGKVAALFFLLGTIAFSLVAYRALILGRPESTPMIFIMALLYIASLLCVMSGLLAELNVRILYHVGTTKPWEVKDSLNIDEIES